MGALMSDTVSYIDVPDKPPTAGDNVPSLETLQYQSSEFERGAWAGVSADKAKATFENLYNIGLFQPTNFGITLRPFDPNSKIAEAEVPLYSSYELGTLLLPDFETRPKQDLVKLPLISEEFTALPFLCASVPISLIDAISESVNAGHYQINYLTGNSSPEITLQMIETRGCDIANSALAIKDIMFNDDGTVALPNDYLMVMEIYAYDRHSRSVQVLTVKHPVMLSSGSVELNVDNRGSTGIVPLTFTQMFPNLKVI